LPPAQAGPLWPLLDRLLSKDPAQRPDARTVIGLIEEARASGRPSGPDAPAARGRAPASPGDGRETRYEVSADEVFAQFGPFSKFREPSPEETVDAHTAILMATGRYAEAVTALREGIALRPGDWVLHGRLGVSLWKLQRHQEAEPELREASRLAPDSPYPHKNLGGLYAELSRLAEAEAELREAIRLKPDYDEVRAMLEEVLRAAGNQRRRGLFRRRPG
jgi:tetratricopeptide (TPR) repeat protein